MTDVATDASSSVEPDEPTQLEDLPSECLRIILSKVSLRIDEEDKGALYDGMALARTVCVSHAWHAAVTEVAEARLRKARPSIPENADCPCWLRCLLAYNFACDTLGPRDSESVVRGVHKPPRNWREENCDIRRVLDVQWTMPLSTFDTDPWVLHKVEQHGWRHEDAVVFAGMAGMHQIHGVDVLDSIFPASLHAWLDAAFNAAVIRPPPALDTRRRRPSRLYANLSGDDGLRRLDGFWRYYDPTLAYPPSIGDFYTTMAAIDAKAARRINFRDDAGWYAYNGGWIETNEETGLSEFHEDIDYDARAFELRDSDIVCFLQGERDDKSGFTALIHEPRPNDVDDIYHLPPYATVTLISIEEPGEWELELELDDEDAPPLQAPRLQRRLYTVTVSYGI